MNRTVDATLRLIDKFSGPITYAGKTFRTQTNYIKKQGHDIVREGKKLEGYGKSLTRSVTAPIVALSAATGKMALEHEDNMANINTLLDDTSHLKLYDKAVKDTSKSTGKSLEDMAKGMYQTISSIGDGGRETTKIFGVMAKSAKAGGAETSAAVSLISAGMKGYNSVSAETAQRISDLAFNAAKLGVTTFPEMAESMQPLFPLSSSLNVSYEELFGSMATLTGVTGNTAEVTTQLKGVFTGLMKPTERMKNLFEKYGYANGEAMVKAEGLSGVLGILRKETGGASDKMATLFSNSRALTGVLALTGSQYETFNEKLGKMQKSAGATETAYKKLETRQEQLNKAWNKLKVTGVQFGELVLKAGLPYIEKFADKVSQAADKFAKLPEKQQQSILKFVAFAAAVGPVLTIVGKLEKGLGGLVIKFAPLLTRIGLLTGKMGLINHPAAVILGVIAALVVAGVALYKNWDRITAAAKKLGAWINSIFKGLGVDTASLSKRFGEMHAKIAASFENLRGPVKMLIKILSPVVSFTKNVFVGAIKWAAEAVVGRLAAFLKSAVDFADGLLTVFKGITDFISGIFTGNWKKAWTGLKEIVSGAFKGLVAVVKYPLNGVIGLVNSAIKRINSISVDIPEGVPLVGGKHIGFSIPTIPPLYKGTTAWAGGLAQINERGGEIVDLPKGSRVYPHDESVKMAKDQGKTIHLNIAKIADTVVIREEGDIEKLARKLAELLEEYEPVTA